MSFFYSSNFIHLAVTQRNTLYIIVQHTVCICKYIYIHITEKQLTFSML